MTLPLEQDPRPPYVQAAEVLRAAIQRGELVPGEKLPSARALQRRFGVASSTVQNALRVLKDEGLIYSIQGRGSYVRRQGQSSPVDGTELEQAGEGADAQDPADDPRPPYLQTADALRKLIKDGTLEPGNKLPSARELQEQYGIANSTAQNALRVLKDAGLIYSVQGRGVFVSQVVPPTFIPFAPARLKSPDIPAEIRHIEAVRRAQEEAIAHAGTSNEELLLLIEQTRERAAQTEKGVDEAKARVVEAESQFYSVISELNALDAEVERRRRLGSMKPGPDTRTLAERVQDRLARFLLTDIN